MVGLARGASLLGANLEQSCKHIRASQPPPAPLIRSAEGKKNEDWGNEDRGVLEGPAGALSSGRKGHIHKPTHPQGSRSGLL